MAEEPEKPDKLDKIEIPRKLQVEMLKFFLKTSVPRRKKLEEKPGGDPE